MDKSVWKTGLEWQLLIAFSHSNRAIVKRNRQKGLTPGQPKVLQFLSGHDGCTQKEIGLGCAIDKSTVAGLLSRMEADGLIARAESRVDRRETTVTLTQRGRDAAAEAIATARTVDEIALAGLTDSERADLARLLARVIENLAQD